jgi:hypothetical protein
VSALIALVAARPPTPTRAPELPLGRRACRPEDYLDDRLELENTTGQDRDDQGYQGEPYASLLLSILATPRRDVAAGRSARRFRSLFRPLSGLKAVRPQTVDVALRCSPQDHSAYSAPLVGRPARAWGGHTDATAVESHRS